MAFPRAPDAPALTQAEALSYDWRPNDCPVSRTMEVIGGKWKPSILYLLCRGPARFNALQRALPGITQRMLTLQLRALENHGVVMRKVEPSVPPQVEYALTPQGQSLGVVFEALIDWDRARKANANAR